MTASPRSGTCHAKAASLRASKAMAMSEAPPNTMSIPTSRPSAQTIVPGKPEMNAVMQWFSDCIECEPLNFIERQGRIEAWIVTHTGTIRKRFTVALANP